MNDSRLKQLMTADQVVEALDGTTAAAKLAGTGSPAISNALRRGFLPSSTFLVFTEALATRGFTAAPGIWRIKQPRRRRGFQGGNHGR